MEDLSPIAAPQRRALTIPNDARLQDHRFRGQAVLPGVCALEHLARAVDRAFPDTALTSSGGIRFDKFLALPPSDIAQVEAFAELSAFPDGGVEAVLLTRQVAAKSGMTRMKAHVRTRFGVPVDPTDSVPPAPARQDDRTEAFRLSANRLYAEMVPFGPAFQNVVSPVWLRPEGARAVVSGGRPGDDDSIPRLGSPFPLDAAFHAACAWAQRFCGVVAFPVAMQQRVIRHRTRSGRRYDACIRFRGTEGDCLTFDLWLHERDGRLCEFVRGLSMRDVSGGRLQPSAWVRDHLTLTDRRKMH